MRALIIALTVVLSIGLACACGDRTVGDGPCAQVCLELRDKLIQNFGVSPSQIDCLDGSWGAPQTCDACKKLISQRYGVQAVGDEICRHF